MASDDSSSCDTGFRLADWMLRSIPEKSSLTRRVYGPPRTRAIYECIARPPNAGRGGGRHSAELVLRDNPRS
jgi:hypothetical protein